MDDIPRIILTAGILLVIIGTAWHFGSKYLPLGKLPGDLAISKGGFKIYIPLATCIIISIIVSLIFYLFRYFR